MAGFTNGDSRSDTGAANVSDASPANLPSADDVEWETTVCPLCGEDRFQTDFICGDLLYGCPGEFKVVRCERCHHRFLNPRPSRRSIGRFYPSDYGPFRGMKNEASARPTEVRASRFSFRSWNWLKRLVLWWIDSRAAPLPEPGDRERRRALELGCSHGSYLEQLQRAGWSCVGVEPAAEVAARAAANGFDVRVGSLEEAIQQEGDRPSTFSPMSFDAVIAWMVAEHLHDPVSTLKIVRELLAPGGLLMISVPNFGCWERPIFGRYWYALQLPTHLQYFNPTSLLQLVNASGFELVELIHQRNVNNLVGSVGLWLRAMFPRWSLGTRMIRWTDNPSALGLCLLMPLARGLALIRQAGRLTVVARRPDDAASRGEN